LVETPVETPNQKSISMRERFRMQTPVMSLLTLIFGALGAGIFAIVQLIPMPFTMVSLFQFGLAPALSIIAVIGGIRGPIAGFLTGYLGIILYDFVFFGVVIDYTLEALAYGVLGLIVGLSTYDLSRGRSLAKMSILSTIGLIFTALLLVVFGITFKQSSILLELGFVLLPLLTVGLPSVILITPVLARLWLVINQRIRLPIQTM
jgi:hypothetical protein